MKEQKKLILQILDITKTEAEKEEFASHFIDLIFEESVYYLIQSLSPVRRESVSKKWDANAGNAAALKSLLHHNFTEREIKKAAEEVSAKAIDEYLQSIVDQLNTTQKDEIKKLLTTTS